jgi:hypothetical protein
MNVREGFDGKVIDYVFDSSGLYIARQFLAAEGLTQAREALENLEFAPESWAPDQNRATSIHLRVGFLADLAPTLHDHPITRRLISYPPRLLESYALNRTKGHLDLHGGSAEYLTGTEIRDISARSWVENGRIYSLRVKVLIYLDDVRTREAGRLCYVEGSHKASFAFHRAFPRGRTETYDSLVRAVNLSAGDAVWLNEGLLHGAENKTSEGPRRLLAYTYGPSFMADWRELNNFDLTTAGYFSTETEPTDTTE